MQVTGQGRGSRTLPNVRGLARVATRVVVVAVARCHSCLTLAADRYATLVVRAVGKGWARRGRAPHEHVRPRASSQRVGPTSETAVRTDSPTETSHGATQ